MSNLDQLRTWAWREIAAGRPIPVSAAVAISRPTRKQIREWFADCPPNLSKAETIDWLVREAMESLERIKNGQ